MTLEEQVRRHKEISRLLDDLEAEKKALGEVILSAMSEKKMNLGPYLVKKCSRVSISSTIEEARNLNATKMEEVVDKDKLKQLYSTGESVPGIKETVYIQITEKTG
jgi:hypothetical protein